MKELQKVDKTLVLSLAVACWKVSISYSQQTTQYSQLHYQYAHDLSQSSGYHNALLQPHYPLPNPYSQHITEYYQLHYQYTQDPSQSLGYHDTFFQPHFTKSLQSVPHLVT